MNYRRIGELAEGVRGIDLERVLEASGARRHRHDRAKWQTARGPVSVTGAKFISWKRGVGGGGAIDLVMHLRERGFVDAVLWLAERFADSGEQTSPGARLPTKLDLPPEDPGRLSEVKRYLERDRNLTPVLIEPLLASGQIYADPRANAVFVMWGQDGSAVGAEIRGTSPRDWCGMAPGSRKDRGYFSVAWSPLATAVILTESAIDAVSCAEIHPDCLSISTAGARPNPRWLASLLGAGKQVWCGFDADSTGERLAREMIALYPSVKRLRPSHKDWNDTLRSTTAQS